MVQESTNTFSKGMNLDVPEMQIPPEAYTSALNATVTTSDGNELVLQSDMGNGRVLYKDTPVTLSANFIPIGIKEHCGIIYIISYNPDTKQGEIGSFPSPDYLANKVNESINLLYKYLPLHNLEINNKLTNFTTEYFNFDLKHEVSVEIQNSYDGSVNLLLTDGKNKPRLINTGFAVQENGKCSIVLHIGDNNTNIYQADSFEQFDILTSLQKLTIKLPKIEYDGFSTNGALKVGGYVIYIKGSDEDGNTTDVIAESGIIPVFLGNDGDPRSVNGLCGNYKTDKAINLTITNLDNCYSHIEVYYSRSTSNIMEDSITTCHKLVDLVPNINGVAKICITGMESAQDVDESEINETYFIVKSSKATTISNNITFIGNVVTENTKYETLKNLSLHIVPRLHKTSFNDLVKNKYGTYKSDDYLKVENKLYNKGGYYQSKNVYNFVGYHNEEIYRFGIVYIFSDGSKSEVYNVLGVNSLTIKERDLSYYLDLNTDIQLDEDKLFLKDDPTLNSKGVCRLMGNSWNPWNVLSLSFIMTKELREKLESLGVIGYFYVRLKRIPLKLCLAYTTPVFENAFIPAIRYGASIKAKFLEPGLEKGNPNLNPGMDCANYYGVTSPSELIGKTTAITKHTYIAESFFNACYWWQGKDFDLTLKGKYEADAYNAPGLIFIPIGANSQSPTKNTGGDKYPDNFWKLYLDYTSRILILLDKGYLAERHTYPEGKNLKVENSNNLTFVNGTDVVKNGKYRWCGAIGGLPMSNTLQRGAFAGFCPEFLVNQEFYNNIFTGAEFTIKVIRKNIKLNMDTERVFYATDAATVDDRGNEQKQYLDYPITISDAKIISIEDAVSLRGIQRNREDLNKFNSYYTYRNIYVNNKNDYSYKMRDMVYFSSKIGDPNDIFGMKTIGGEHLLSCSSVFKLDSFDHVVMDDTNQKKITGGYYGFSDDESESLKLKYNLDQYFTLPYMDPRKPTNFVRGLFSPYIGIYIPETNSNILDLHTLESSIINIYAPGFKESNIKEYLKMCMRDGSPYYRIGDSIEITDINNPEQFRGDCYASVATHRLNRNFLDPAAPDNDIIVTEKGYMHSADDKVNPLSLYEIKDETEYIKHSDVTTKVEGSKALKKNGTNIGDMNAIQLGSWITFDISSTFNLSLRGEDRTWPSEKTQMGLYRSFYPLYGVNIGGGGKIEESIAYNKGFSISGGVLKWYSMESETFMNYYYKNRIYYSNVDVTSFSTNGARTILSTHFRDYDTKFGEIISLIDSLESLLCILEHGITIIPVKPLALLDSGTSGSVYINTNNVLHDKWSVISDTYGTLYKQSIVQTPSAIYGIDTYAKKIWRLRGSQIEIISDDNINSYLNDFLTLNNEQLEVGKLMIRSQYNAAKKDVIFSFYSYDEKDSNNNVLWSICFNETLGNSNVGWITFYSWIPEISGNIGNSLISFDHKQIKNIIDKTYSIENGKLSNRCNLWKHGAALQLIKSEEILPTKWYGLVQPFEIEFVVNQNPGNHKIYSNLKLLGNKAKPESFHYEVVGQAYENVIDKPTEYFRLERTKQLWHKAGASITYDKNYTKFEPVHRPLWHYENDLYVNWQNDANSNYYNMYVKSLVPWNYYVRTHNPNDIENYYYLATNNSRNYAYLVGTELVHNRRNLEIRIQIHAKGEDMEGPGGVLRGNMRYKEETWYVNINPLLYKEKNEKHWILPPIIINNTLVPSDVDMDKLNDAAFNTLKLTSKDFDTSTWGERKSLKLRDKYIKIRIRYSGHEKVFLQAVKTLYNNSYV